MAAVSVLYRKALILALLLFSIAASIALQLTPAFILRNIIDNNFTDGVMDGVWRLALLYLAVTVGINIVEFLNVTFTTILGQSILMDVRGRMAQRLSDLPINYFVKTPVGDIMSRLTNDIDAINNLFSAGIINAISDMTKVIGLMISLFLLAQKLFPLEIAFIPVIYLMSNFFRKRIFAFQKNVRRRISDIYTFIQEWISGIRVVKAYSAERRGKDKFQTLLSNLLKEINNISSYDSWFPCVTQILRMLLIATVVWFGAKNGTALSLGLSIGTLAALTDLIGKLFAPIESLALQFQTIQQSMAGIERVNSFFAEPVEERVLSDAHPDDSGIVIENLNFSYGDFNVLNDVSLVIDKGEKAVFIGRSGAGKTTLMNLVSGLYAPKCGTIRVCGVDPFALPPEKRRRLIGIVPQMPQVFDGTVKENITLRDTSITFEQVVNAAKTVGIHEMIMSLPKGYDTVIGEGEAGLSSGEIQLLSIARAIAADPRVLLLDEPTSGMDTITEKRIFDAIRATSEGRTIFSISHRLSGIIDADKIYIVAQHGIVEQGTQEQLAAKNGWYAMYSKIEAAGWNAG